MMSGGDYLCIGRASDSETDIRTYLEINTRVTRQAPKLRLFIISIIPCISVHEYQEGFSIEHT